MAWAKGYYAVKITCALDPRAGFVMPVIRTFGCDDCGLEFEVTQGMNDAAPECPRCCVVLEWRPQSFNITGNKSRAMNLTQQILETEYGLTNFRDNQREGDIAAINAGPPPVAVQDAQTRQLSEIAQASGAPPLTAQQAEMAKAFWGGGQTPLQQIPAAQMLADAKAATADANANGVNPMDLLHKAGKAGKLKTPINIMARG